MAVIDFMPGAEFYHAFTASLGLERKVNIAVVHAAFALNGGSEFIPVLDRDFREAPRDEAAAGVVRSGDQSGFVLFTAALANGVGFGNDVARADIAGFAGAFQRIAAAVGCPGGAAGFRGKVEDNARSAD